MTTSRKHEADNISNRLLCQHLALSSWTSSAPAASQSPPSSHTLKPSSSAPAARRSFASPPVARQDSPRAALSGGSRLLRSWNDDTLYDMERAWWCVERRERSGRDCCRAVEAHDLALSGCHMLSSFNLDEDLALWLR